MEKPKNMTTELGKTVTLSCLSDKSIFPPASTTWFYSPSPTGDLHRLTGNLTVDQSVLLSNENQHLVLLSPTTAQQGYYFCTLNNALGNVTSWSYMGINGKSGGGLDLSQAGPFRRIQNRARSAPVPKNALPKQTKKAGSDRISSHLSLLQYQA